LLVAIGCSSTEPGGSRVVHGPALLAFYGEVTEVHVPTTVQVGVPFTVTATSFGGGCIAPGETRATISELRAEVRPYRAETLGVACTSELRLDQNAALVQFDTPGEGQVRIIGLGRPGEQPYVVERRVLVSP
jgi:hypothetical protein